MSAWTAVLLRSTDNSVAASARGWHVLLTRTISSRAILYVFLAFLPVFFVVVVVFFLFLRSFCLDLACNAELRS